MNSINLFETFHYKQPTDYRFSHDSVFLARKVFEITQGESLARESVLDLCAGCGIVGLDFLYHCSSVKDDNVQILDFLEVQNIYKEFLNENIKELKRKTGLCPSFTTYFQNYDSVSKNPLLFEKYDLIISNPPYFKTGHGKLSDSEFKNRCRFFIDSDFQRLIKSMIYLLKPGGNAFFLNQSLANHNIDLIKELNNFNEFKLVSREKIRDTDFYQITKY